MEANADVKGANHESGVMFTLFPKLSPELRNNIWKHACSIPRILDLWREGLPSFGDRVPGTNIKPFLYRSHSRTPAILHTSKESRKVGLEHYTLAFGMRVKNKESAVVRTVAQPKIYINWEYDILFPVPVFCFDPSRWNYWNEESTKEGMEFVRVLALQHLSMKRIAIASLFSSLAEYFSNPIELEEIIICSPFGDMLYRRMWSTARYFNKGTRLTIELRTQPGMCLRDRARAESDLDRSVMLISMNFGSSQHGWSYAALPNEKDVHELFMEMKQEDPGMDGQDRAQKLWRRSVISYCYTGYERGHWAEDIGRVRMGKANVTLSRANSKSN